MSAREQLKEQIISKAVVHGKVILSSGKEADSYMYMVVGVIVLITLIPMVFGLFKEWRTKHHLS